MGLYATLKNGTVTCPTCGAVCTDDWQFHFGAVSDLPSYGIGDVVRWSGGQWFGQPTLRLIYALAYNVREPACVRCGTETLIAEIRIRNGVIEGIGNPRAIPWLPELLYEGEDRVPLYHDDLYRNPAGRPVR